MIIATVTREYSPIAAGLRLPRTHMRDRSEPDSETENPLPERHESTGASRIGPIGRAISFGSFRLLPAQRLLLDADKPVRLGSRSMEILITLAERPGELVTKAELIARVWPNTHVVEGNLKFQVAALRRALGDGRDGRRYLETSSGQGYRFVAAVTVTNNLVSSGSQPAVLPTRHNLLGQVTHLIGRSDLVAKLVNDLPKQRLLTVVGPGGIGKTAVAIAVAGQLIGAYEHGVWLVDLARLDDPTLASSTLAAAVGVDINPEEPLTGLVAALREKRMLMVLDNCTHLIDAVATLVVSILRSAPSVHILATSREPLRVESEHVHRLGPLESPPPSALLKAQEALRFPAIQLFAKRAAESICEFELRDEDVSVVGDICRKLDGIPLAIEFAAARVGVLGVRGLSARLDDRLRVLTSGRRTVAARHKTMRATLDWSYSLLTASEQTILLRLAIFAGGFTLSAAAAVAGDASHSGDEIIESVLRLAEKSLVATDADEAEPRFRLLETTRAYALEKLVNTGEHASVARRHSEYYSAHAEDMSVLA